MELEFSAILDKIIDMTEKNLEMQGEFIQAVYELKTRFDTSDRDHKDTIENIKLTVTNSYDIINTMKAASNEKVIRLLEEMKAKKEADIIMMAEAFRMMQEVKERHCAADPEKVEMLGDLVTGAFKDLSEEVKKISDSSILVKKVLLIISLGVLGVQLIFGIINSLQNQNVHNVNEIRKEIKDNINKTIKQ